MAGVATLNAMFLQSFPWTGFKPWGPRWRARMRALGWLPSEVRRAASARRGKPRPRSVYERLALMDAMGLVEGRRGPPEGEPKRVLVCLPFLPKKW